MYVAAFAANLKALEQELELIEKFRIPRRLRGSDCEARIGGHAATRGGSWIGIYALDRKVAGEWTTLKEGVSTYCALRRSRMTIA